MIRHHTASARPAGVPTPETGESLAKRPRTAYVPTWRAALTLCNTFRAVIITHRHQAVAFMAFVHIGGFAWTSRHHAEPGTGARCGWAGSASRAGWRG